MSEDSLRSTIDDGWEERETISPATGGALRDAIEAALDGLDSGSLRVAEKVNGSWHVNQWLKKAVLLSFRLYDTAPMPGGPDDPNRGATPWFDKVSPKFAGWDEARFREAGFRAVPNCIVRRSAYIAPGVILMPSFVNLGAYVDRGTMVDTWATVGSCAQIGRNCHISGGAGIGGVLEPLQADPVIVEDDCFIGARIGGRRGRAGGARLGAVDGRVHRRLDQDRRPDHGRGPLRPGARILGRGAGFAAGASAGRRLARAQPLLRGHRQASR